MRQLRSSFFVLALALVPVFGQTAEDLESPAVNRVANKMLCPCGCKMNMACRMDPYPCKTCWDNKKKILNMQAAGMPDEAILAKFQQDMGKEVVAVQPGVLGLLSFYTAAALGLLLVLWVIRRYSRKPVAGGAGRLDEAMFDHYHDQIEKEVEKLD